jgi:hypothetical protein
MASVVPKFVLGLSAPLNGKARRPFDILGEDVQVKSREVRHLLRRGIEVKRHARLADVRPDEPRPLSLDVLRFTPKNDAPESGNRLRFATADTKPERRQMCSRYTAESLLPDLRNTVLHDEGC